MAVAVLPGEGLRNVVQNIVPYLSLEDLKRVRLTCKAWGEGVTKHPSFLRKATLVLNKYSEAELRRIEISFPRIPRYTRARLEACHLQRGRLMQNYWRIYVKNILRKLELSKVLCRCTFLCTFVNQLPALVELKVEDVHFKTDVVPALRNEPERIIYCSHNGLEIGFRPGPATLRHFSCKGMPVLPNCFLTLIQSRCDGQLQSFEYTDANMRTERREKSIPLIDLQTQQIQGLIEANMRTLRKFSWKNNSTMGGMRFLEVRLGPNQLPAWFVNDMTLEQPRDRTETSASILNVVQRAWRNPADNLLTKLNLTFYVSDFMNRLRTVLANQNMRNLREFGLSMNGLSQDTVLDLPLTGYQHLQVLEVKQNAKDKHRAIPTFLSAVELPNTLEILRVDLSGTNTPMLVNIPVRHQNIRALHIGQLRKDLAQGDPPNGDANRFDNYMQLILASLHQLEDLAITDSFTLTDYGLTGIPKETAKMINLTMNYDFITQAMGNGHSISNLRHLKKLNLSGSRNVSDVSIFQLSSIHLREINLNYLLNVTDFGLIKLANQNRSLETVMVQYNPRISFFGLTQLVKKCKGLTHVHCSDSVSDREFPGIDIAESPDYEFKVKSTR